MLTDVQVRAVLAARLQSLCQGFSGVSRTRCSSSWVDC
jgi:histidine ammonia-lyase